MAILGVCVLVLLAALPIAGLGWLLFRRCRFSLAQLFVTMLAFGLAMSISKSLVYPHEQDKLIVWAIIHATYLSIGLFLGARGVASLPENASSLYRWFWFTCCLVSGYVLTPVVLILLGVGIWVFFIALFIFLFVLGPMSGIAALLFVVVMIVLMTRKPARKQKKR